MLLLYKRRGIFIHVPKTGGISIKSALEPFCDTRSSMFAWHPLAGSVREVIADFDTYWRFAFVRNPWDLHLSWWKYIRAHGDHPYHAQLAALETFERYVREGLSPHHLSYNLQNQVDWISDAEGNPLVNFVGRFERLREDWQVVCDALKLGDLKLPHLNATTPVDYHEFYTPKMAEIVRTVNARDIAAFGYTFAGA
jgi:chondroitin 4-sulfotransferase 11